MRASPFDPLCHAVALLSLTSSRSRFGPYSGRIGSRFFEVRMKARPNLGTMNERAKMRRLFHGAAGTPFLRCTPPNQTMLVSSPRALSV